MQLKNLFTDEDAVSPVIGVILMVAITVILAAVIGAFVLGIGSSQEKAPQATTSFNYNSSGAVEVLHDGGETLEASALSLNSNFGSTCTIGADEGLSTMSAGQTVVGDSGADDGAAPGTDTEELCPTSGSSGDSLTITWTASSGDSSQILAESTIP